MKFDHADALERTDEKCTTLFAKYDFQKWRDTRYWNEECDSVLKKYKGVIDGVYGKYSGAKSLPGKKPFVSLDEFRKLCIDAGLLDDKFVERDLNICFCSALMTQVDELNTDKVIEMYWVEFIEAISRAAEICDLYPISMNEEEVNRNLEKTTDSSDLPLWWVWHFFVLVCVQWNFRREIEKRLAI